MTLYTCEINLETFVVERSQHEDYDGDENYESAEAAREAGYIDGGPGYATYEESLDGNFVYAESVVSQEHADNLVREFCFNQFQKYKIAFESIVKDKRSR